MQWMLGNGNLVICSTEIVVVTWSLCICGDNSGLSNPHFSIQRKKPLPWKWNSNKTCWFPDFNLSCQKVINAAPWELPVLWYFLYYIWSYFTRDFSISHFLLKVFTFSAFYILQCKNKTKTKKQKAKHKMSELQIWVSHNNECLFYNGAIFPNPQFQCWKNFGLHIMSLVNKTPPYLQHVESAALSMVLK